MKRKNYLLKCCGLLAAGFLGIGAGLTGCAGREAEILLENSQEEAEEEVSGSEGNEQAGSSEAADASGNLPQVTETPAEIFVDVCGAVVNPGVYELEFGSRVFMAIEAAGGYLQEAALGYINRAGLLTDGQMIYVPTKKEAERAERGGIYGEGNVGWETFGETALQTGEAGADDTKEADAKPAVNLNTADEAALMTITGIGASKAKAIIAYREANGPFRSTEDIMNVEGIKEGTFAKIKDEIVVG